MDLLQFAADAAASPPSAPADPESGYPTAGNPATGTPATLLGDYWFYQLAAEMAAVLSDASITPDYESLTQLRDALRSLGTTALMAMDFPTVVSVGNILTITPASGAGGGTVSVAAGTQVVLGEEVVSGKTGRSRTVETVAYTSGSLDTGSTYYLRGQIVGGALSLYVQKGTDTDPIPAGLKGTPGAASGGGFDSTPLDVLLAKIATSFAGVTPTVTALANAARLESVTDLTCGAIVNPGTNGSTAPFTATLNFARTPNVLVWPVVSSQAGYDFLASNNYDDDFSVSISTKTRYLVSGVYLRDFFDTTPPVVRLHCFA